MGGKAGLQTFRDSSCCSRHGLCEPQAPSVPLCWGFDVRPLGLASKKKKKKAISRLMDSERQRQGAGIVKEQAVSSAVGELTMWNQSTKKPA